MSALTLLPVLWYLLSALMQLTVIPVMCFLLSVLTLLASHVGTVNVAQDEPSPGLSIDNA